ncbi:MAG: 2-oxoacid:acceptor oxidoreductase subunit alpha [Acidobacteriota bacterium]|jgi:2-oxoglutarate ferredoxin oxidoreductase subunit alpha
MSKERRGAVLTGEHFMNGDTAAAEGALAVGCRFFGGYPITPATEVAERMAERLPEVGGTYIQMEDELASMNAILGASWAGVKSMTSTSGPGFSLMMENFGLGVMMETPCVLVNVQRGGPSTGLPTLVGQADMMQARWGSHGDYEIIALCPTSPQDCFDLTITAFNLSEKYRVPVLLMTDEVIGHMTEKVVIPPEDQIHRIERKKFTGAADAYLPYLADDDLVPPMVSAGEGYRIHTTGLTHDERGYPDMSAEAHDVLVRRLVAKIRDNIDDIAILEEDGIEDADVVVISYGISARISYRAVELARAAGIRCGLLRLVTVWPFPEQKIRKLAENVGAFVVPEINLGQVVLEVERCAAGKCDTVLVSNPGGHVHHPNEILQAIEAAAKGGRQEVREPAYAN